MSWLHTWGGLLIGWLLYVIFLTGTASYFKQEISVWTRPEAPISADINEGLTRAYDWLTHNHAGAAYWLINAPSERNPMMETYWTDAAGEYHAAMLDPRTGAPAARETLGGEFFYRFHFELQIPYPWGRWLASLTAFLMLVALISGIITHKRFFKDFFTFRPNKAAQRSWLDAHNVMGVLTLPFHIMIAFTGMVTLMTMLMPWSMSARYGEDLPRYYAERFGDSYSVVASGTSAPLAPITPILRESDSRFDAPIGRLLIEQPGDANARIEVIESEQGRIGYRPPSLIFSGVDGGLREERGETRPAALTEDILYGLHMGRYGGLSLRWLYFFCGLSGAAMVATGMVLWTVKRAPKPKETPRFHLGNRIVEGFNLGAILGTPLGMSAFFWASRSLPLNLAERTTWEARAFLITMALAIIYAFVRPVRRAWIELGALAALAFLGLPALNALTSARGLPASLFEGDTTFAAMDCAFLAIGAAFAFLTYRVATAKPKHEDAA